jgi:RimJ/RimL family protein N-acetyltransferase
VTDQPLDSFAAIPSERLDLVWMTPAFIEASLKGERNDAVRILGASLPRWWPDEEASRQLALRLQQMKRDPASAEWLLRTMVRRADKKAVGVINFHGSPEAGCVELGYMVIDEYRRQGFAFEAATAMMRWARASHEVQRFIAKIGPENAASIGLAAKLGFRKVSTRIDDVDGEEFVFERPAWCA